MPSINKQILRQATGSSDADAGKFLPYVNSALNKYNINTANRITAFLAQIGEESDHLKATEEYASGAAYEGRSDLGNTVAGDGVKFKGRGAIQLTGRKNYLAVSKALGVDFINNPQLLSTPKYAIEASAWWWDNHGLNQIADTMDVRKSLTDPQNKAAFERITKIINGGYNGLAQRKSNWEQGVESVVYFLKEHQKTVIAGVAASILLAATAIYYFVNRNKIEAPAPQLLLT